MVTGGLDGSTDSVLPETEADDTKGLIPRSVEHIFKHVRANEHNCKFTITLSFLQIYMETVTDLLDPAKGPLNIREDPKSGVFVDNLMQVYARPASAAPPPLLPAASSDRP